MKHIGQVVLVNHEPVAETRSWDFDLPPQAEGVIVEIQTSNGANGPVPPSFVFSLGNVWENGAATPLVATAAIHEDTVSRIGIMPGLLAESSLFTREPTCGMVRFTAFRYHGSFDLHVIAHFFKV